jgi:hypothetical protein
MFKYLSSIYITLLVTGIASGFKLLPGKFNFLSKDLHEIALSNTYHGRSQLHMASSDLAAAQDLTKVINYPFFLKKYYVSGDTVIFLSN